MADRPLATLPITELAPMIAARDVSPVEVVDAAIMQAERLQPQVNGFITLMHEQARARAQERETAIARGEYRGPLDGVPVGIKDNISVAGMPLTAGAKALDDQMGVDDAEAVARLKSAGAIIMGKENLPDFAGGGRSNNPHFGFVRNPWDLERIPAARAGAAAQT